MQYIHTEYDIYTTHQHQITMQPGTMQYCHVHTYSVDTRSEHYYLDMYMFCTSTYSLSEK